MPVPLWLPPLVTAHLCAAVQEDTLWVVLDHRADCTANTGDFELINKQVRKGPPPLQFKVYVEVTKIMRLI